MSLLYNHNENKKINKTNILILINYYEKCYRSVIRNVIRNVANL